MYIKINSKQTQRGVSLIEVLISLLIVAVGVLGLAKMQALTVANTQTSGARGLIALQAASLAALMHSNKGYWQVATGTHPYCPSSSCTLKGTSTTLFGSVPSTCASTSTSSATCNIAQMAAYDVNNWMAQMNINVPTYTAVINCDNSGGTLPVTCSIEVDWLEKQAGGGTATASIANATPAVTQAFYLYVQP